MEYGFYAVCPNCGYYGATIKMGRDDYLAMCIHCHYLIKKETKLNWKFAVVITAAVTYVLWTLLKI